MEEEFFAAMADALEIEDREISLEDTFRDYPEWDSLTQLTLIATLDENYEVEIEMADFNKLLTVGELLEEVKKRKL